MMEFDIDSRVQPIGKREGQTVYFARLKSQQKLTNDMVIVRIVRETSLLPCLDEGGPLSGRRRPLDWTKALPWLDEGDCHQVRAGGLVISTRRQIKAHVIRRTD